MTKDLHEWRYSHEKKVFQKYQAIHLNVSKSFAYSEKRKLEASNPNSKAIKYTVTDNGSLLYNNEFPPKTKRRNAYLSKQKTTLSTLQER